MTEATVADVATLYDDDFYAWALGQAETLRQLAETRPNLPLDFPHLIDEVEDLARSQRRGVLRQLDRLIQHLLKLEYSVRAEPRRQWLISVNDARGELDLDLTPAIRTTLPQELPRIFERARRAAALALADHGEVEASRALATSCPYRLDELIDQNWLPSNRHGLVDEPI
jgi:Domain of unknown function DUF29